MAQISSSVPPTTNLEGWKYLKRKSEYFFCQVADYLFTTVFTLILFFLEDYEKGQEAHFFFVSPSSTGPPCPQRINFNLKIFIIYIQT